MASDPARSREISERLHGLAIDRAERWWPGMNSRPEESLRALISDARDVSESVTSPGATEYSRSGVVFAARASQGAIELRLGPEIAEAARRTPDTSASPRGAEWVSFAPKQWDQHEIDRLEAWFRVAWRQAAAKSS